MNALQLQAARMALPVAPQVRSLLTKPLLAAVVSLAAVPAAFADEPGRGAAAEFEKTYLTFIIDHHYSALRMSELAAGTDRTRDPAVNNPAEGTSPTPDFADTAAKSMDPNIRSMARQANRAQREEIRRAQDFLHMWYGVHYSPVLSAEDRAMIGTLERTPQGAQFDRTFLRMFSSHHYTALAPSMHCQVESDLRHEDLRRYCENIVVTQKNEINDMREMLCKRFSECGFVPIGPGKTREHD